MAKEITDWSGDVLTPPFVHRLFGRCRRVHPLLVFVVLRVLVCGRGGKVGTPFPCRCSSLPALAVVLPILVPPFSLVVFDGFMPQFPCAFGVGFVNADCINLS